MWLMYHIPVILSLPTRGQHRYHLTAPLGTSASFLPCYRKRKDHTNVWEMSFTDTKNMAFLLYLPTPVAISYKPLENSGGVECTSVGGVFHYVCIKWSSLGFFCFLFFFPVKYWSRNWKSKSWNNPGNVGKVCCLCCFDSLSAHLCCERNNYINHHL